MCERVGEDATEAGERDRERDGVMKCDTERVGRGWSCSCVSAHEGCTISAAAQVKLNSNPRIKNLCWFAKPDYWHFPTFLYCHPTVRWPLHALNFCHLQRKWPPVIYLFMHTQMSFQLSIRKAVELWNEKKKECGQKNTDTHTQFLPHASHICPGGPLVRSPGIQTTVQLLPLHLNIEPVLFLKELPHPSKSLETIITSLHAPAIRGQVCCTNSFIPAGCWQASDCCLL